jgi:hypothetical protein
VDVIRHILRDREYRDILIGCIPLDQIGWMCDEIGLPPEGYYDHVATRFILKSNANPESQDSRMSFSAFRLKYEQREIPEYAPFAAERPEDGYSHRYLGQIIFSDELHCLNLTSQRYSCALQSALATLSSEIPSSCEASYEGKAVTCFQVSRSAFRKLVSVLQEPLSMQEEASRLVGCPEEFCKHAFNLFYGQSHEFPVHYQFSFSVRDEIGEPNAIGFTETGLVALRDLWKHDQKKGLQYPRLAKQRFQSEPLMFIEERMCFAPTKKNEFGLTLGEQKIADEFEDPYSPHKTK